MMILRPFNTDELKSSLSYRTKAEIIHHQQQQHNQSHNHAQTHTIKSQSAAPIKLADSLTSSQRTRYFSHFKI